MPTLTTQLDRLEGVLPYVPARIVRLQRTIAAATYDQFTGAVKAWVDASTSLLGTAQTASRTVTGQTRAARTDVLTTATRNAKMVVGQARAQGRHVASRAKEEATDLIDTAIDSVDPNPGSTKPYEQRTKAELLERAQELGIAGRTSLNKKQLIAALRNA